MYCYSIVCVCPRRLDVMINVTCDTMHIVNLECMYVHYLCEYTAVLFLPKIALQHIIINYIMITSYSIYKYHVRILTYTPVDTHTRVLTVVCL